MPKVYAAACFHELDCLPKNSRLFSKITPNYHTLYFRRMRSTNKKKTYRVWDEWLAFHRIPNLYIRNYCHIVYLYTYLALNFHINL